MRRHTSRGLLSVLALLGLALAALPLASAQGETLGKIEPALRDRFSTRGTADFIVRFADQADLSAAYVMDWVSRGRYVYDTLTATAARTQAHAQGYLDRRGLAYRSFFSGNELYVWAGTLDAAAALAARPEVAALTAPRTYYVDPVLAQAPAATPETLAWGIVDTGAYDFWTTLGFQGEGIVVAGIDTGVQWDHPALDQAYKCPGDPGSAACWADPSNICGGTPCDNNGHGTHTLGTMVADDDPSLTWQAGMAPRAQWIACKGCESSSCSEYALNACGDWLLAPDGNPDNRPHAVNNSWGGGGCNTWYLARVNAWRAAGIFPAFSIGGGGPNCGTLGSPSDYQESFAAAAHDSSRNIASFSSRGPSCFGHDPYTKPNLSAPGVSICSCIPTNAWSCGYSGTSMSSPHAAGAVALLWSCNPSLIGQLDQTFEALQDAADTPPAGNCGAPPDGEGNYTYGYGYLNIYAAGLLWCQAGWLDGHVYDTGGMPLSGAVVRVEPGPHEALTDAGGYYTMTLAPGIYTATAGAYGYLSETVVVEIMPDGVTTEDFYLEPDACDPIGDVTFDWTPPLPLVGQVVTFTGSASGSPPILYSWDLGDGAVADGQVVTHSYLIPGTYTVTLVAQNDCGEGLAVDRVTVTAACIPPSGAAFTWTPPWPLVGGGVAFTGSAAGTPPLSFAWSFGDGQYGSGMTPTHTYAAAGAYPVALTVTNDCGFTDTHRVAPVFGPPPCPPFAPRPASIQEDPVNRGVWSTTDFQVVNLDYTQTLSARFLDPAGEEAAAFPRTLPAGGTAYYTPSAMLPPAFTGTLVVQTPYPAALGVVHLEDGGNTLFPGVDEVTLGDAAYTPLDDGTRFYVHNAAPAPAALTLFVFDPGGALVGPPQTTSVPPQGTIALDPAAAYQLPAGFSGSAVLSATPGLPIEVTAWARRGGLSSFVAPSRCGPVLLAPHVPPENPGLVTTTLTVQNPTTATVSGTVSYSDGSSVHFELPPWGAVVLHAPPGAGGWAAVRADQPLAAVVQSAGSAVLTATITGTHAYRAIAWEEATPAVALPALFSGYEGWQTGDSIWVMNAATATANVKIRFTGAPSGTAWLTGTVEPGRSWQVAMPDLPAGRAAALLLADRPIVALAGGLGDVPDGAIRYAGTNFVFSYEPVQALSFDYTAFEQTVHFTAAVAAGDPPIHYTWDLGDGATGTGPTLTHLYAAPGDYTVVATATNALGFGAAVTARTVLVRVDYLVYLPLVSKDR